MPLLLVVLRIFLVAELILDFDATLLLLPMFARSRLRRDRAAPAGCKATGYGQVDLELDLFSSGFQQCLSPIDRHRLVSDVRHGRCTSSALNTHKFMR